MKNKWNKIEMQCKPVTLGYMYFIFYFVALYIFKNFLQISTFKKEHKKKLIAALF